MATKKGPQDDKLVRELYEKLNWFTFQATEEEFDPEQVQAILKLLDSMDPLPEGEAAGARGPSVEAADTAGAGRSSGEAADALAASEAVRKSSADVSKAGRASDARSVDSAVKGEEPVQLNNAAAAFERFKKKYNITDEELARKDAAAAGGEKIVPFPAEFSEELAFDSVQMREAAAKKTVGAEKQSGEKSAFLEKAAGTRLDADAVADKKKAVGTTQEAAGSRKRRGILSSIWGKIAAAFAVVVVSVGVLGIGTSAVRQKPFLDVVREGVNGFKFTITGNEMEIESIPMGETDKVYYHSWEEVAAENSNVKIPDNIPDDLNLSELYKQEYGNYTLYEGFYYNADKNMMSIRVRCYKENYTKFDLENEEFGDLIEFDEKEGVRYYQLDDNYTVVWSNGKCTYTIVWNDKDIIKKIVNSLS